MNSGRGSDATNHHAPTNTSIQAEMASTGTDGCTSEASLGKDGGRGGAVPQAAQSQNDPVTHIPPEPVRNPAPAGTTQSAWEELASEPTNALGLPPGFAGTVAQFIYETSYYPVTEVAISAALGFLAGVCGRAYRTHTGKDLALYIILVARSGSGKDGIHDGIQRLVEEAAVPGAEKFIRIANFASGPALHKALLVQPGFLYLQGEFGRKLKGMATPSNAPMQELRTVMTDAYAKRFLEAKTYSGTENSLPGVACPALSFLGETTPGTFLESLTPDMMEDGFMSRFLVITYSGERPSPNDQRDARFDGQDLEDLRRLLRRTLPYQMPLNAPQPGIVGFANNSAEEKLRMFELDCNERLRASDDESVRQTFNRAHLKALKVACLLAVADNPEHPLIDLSHATWAKSLVKRDIEAFEANKRTGDIGISDHTRAKKVLSLIHDYLSKPPAPSHRVPKGMREVGVFPRAYLQHCISSSRAFLTGLGCTANLNATLKNLEDDGHIMSISSLAAGENWGFHGKCYRYIGGKLIS